MEIVDSESVTLGGGDSETITLEWEPSRDDGGAYLATASSDDDEDSEEISVGSYPDPEDAWAIPVGQSWVEIEAEAPVDVDNESITLSAVVDEIARDQLTDLRLSGDSDEESTAFGAFRRERRDDGPIRELIPPSNWSPPFQPRFVVPLSYDEDPVGMDHYRVTIELGLEQPRGRDPPEIDETIDVASTSVSLEAGESTTTTIEWQTGPGDGGVWNAEVRTESSLGAVSTDATTLSVSTTEYGIAFPTGTINLAPENIGPISRSSNDGIEEVEVTLLLEGRRTATLFATGSRTDAAVTRSVPGGQNIPVDTLPDNDLTAEIKTPSDAELDSGEYILSDWSVSRTRAIGDTPYMADLTFWAVETYDVGVDEDILLVGSGEVHHIPEGETETYRQAILPGSLIAEGGLVITEDPD